MPWNIWYYQLRWREMLYLTISWCYGSKSILWIQLVLGCQSNVWSPKCTGGGVNSLGISPKFYQFLFAALLNIYFVTRKRNSDCSNKKHSLIGPAQLIKPPDWLKVNLWKRRRRRAPENGSGRQFRPSDCRRDQIRKSNSGKESGHCCIADWTAYKPMHHAQKYIIINTKDTI